MVGLEMARPESAEEEFPVGFDDGASMDVLTSAGG